MSSHHVPETLCNALIRDGVSQGRYIIGLIIFCLLVDKRCSRDLSLEALLAFMWHFGWTSRKALLVPKRFVMFADDLV